MMKKKINIMLGLFLFVLLAVLGTIRILSVQKLNYYQLNEYFYLHKRDYFSSYSISTSIDKNEYYDIITEVKDIAINKDSIVVRYMKENNIKYIIIKNDTTFYNQNNASDIKSISSALYFVKPWKIVEQKTLSNKSKLLSQILIICIIILMYYLLMQIFRIKKLTKSL